MWNSPCSFVGSSVVPIQSSDVPIHNCTLDRELKAVKRNSDLKTDSAGKLKIRFSETRGTSSTMSLEDTSA